jgi:hypothetical protein
MLTASKWCLILAGVLLIIDAVGIAAGISNPLFGWPLPCPITYVLLGAGILMFSLGSKAFKN